MRFGCILTPIIVPVKAEVTSSNTVGYSKVNLSTGLTCIAPAFFTPGQDTIEIDAMEVVGGKDADNLSLLDSTGNTLRKYYWYPAYGQYAAGWFIDSDGEDPAENVSFDQMEGFLFFSTASAAQLKQWGEVLEADVEGVALTSGYTVLGNPYNKALPLENLVPVNARNADNLTLLDSTGNTLVKYYWYNAYGSYPAGWFFDSDGEDDAVNVTLPPSQAFLFFTTASGATLDVDAP